MVCQEVGAVLGFLMLEWADCSLAMLRRLLPPQLASLRIRLLAQGYALEVLVVALPRRRLHFAINRSNNIYRLGIRRCIQHDLPQSCKFPRREAHSYGHFTARRNQDFMRNASEVCGDD